jgi:hypothetical protein
MGGGFTRPSVHQRSEALKEPCDGLGVFKRGTQWATTQDSVLFPVWCSANWATPYTRHCRRSQPRGRALHWAGYGHREHGHGIHVNMEAGSVN